MRRSLWIACCGVTLLPTLGVAQDFRPLDDAPKAFHEALRLERPSPRSVHGYPALDVDRLRLASLLRSGEHDELVADLFTLGGSLLLWRRGGYWLPTYVHVLAAISFCVIVCINWLWGAGRPVHVDASLLPHRGFPAERVFISYGGLRGAIRRTNPEVLEGEKEGEPGEMWTAAQPRRRT